MHVCSHEFKKANTSAVITLSLHVTIFLSFPNKTEVWPTEKLFHTFSTVFSFNYQFWTANKDIKSGNDPRMQLRKQNANAPGLDSRRSSLNVFSCFFNRLFNKLFTQLRRSFPLFITIYGKHFLLLFIERPVDFVFLSFLFDNLFLSAHVWRS